MAQTTFKLTATTVAQLKHPGRYGDGAGLYLQVSDSRRGGINKSWVFVFQRNGRTREMGLGPITTFGLAEAREKALQCRRQLYDGIDPIDARQAVRAKAKLDAAKSVTFKICAERYIAAHRAAWKNTKHSKQWDSTLETYVYPKIGDVPVQSVDIGLVMEILEPIWSTKAETAGRVRGRIEVILDWAHVRGFRIGENPARWRGHLDKLLPARSRVRKVKHHTALPYKDLSDFMKKLRREDGVAARALEFLILTAARTSEVPIFLFEDIADPADWDLIVSAEAKTNPRVRDEIGDLTLVPVERRVSGSSASIIMGAFTHCSVDRKSRFSDGTYGVWYAGDCFEVALAETIHHHERFMQRTSEAAADSQFRELKAQVGGKLRDLRKPGSERYLMPDDYAASQALAKEYRSAGEDGIVYPSMRWPKGQAVALFWPDLVRPPIIQARHLLYHWDGEQVDRYFIYGEDQWHVPLD